MIETTGSLELLEPVSPESLLPDPWLEPWMILAAVGLAVLIVAITIFVKTRKPGGPDPRAVRKVAFNEATAALAAVAGASARDTAIQCSLIVRKYVSRAAGDPALFETHEETVARHEAFAGFSEEARAAASAGFSRLATLKYEQTPVEADPAEVVGEAQQLLKTLHRGFQT